MNFEDTENEMDNYCFFSGHYFGHLEGSISSLAEKVPEFFSNFSILITCLDSTLDIQTLTKWIDYVKKKECNFEMIGRSMWVPPSFVPEIFQDNRTFFGFDELYLLKHFPKKEIIIENTFTTDGYDFSSTIPSDFFHYFQDLEAVRYLSDGLGINFGCESIEIVNSLLSTSLD
jgi:hypothetical protein